MIFIDDYEKVQGGDMMICKTCGEEFKPIYKKYGKDTKAYKIYGAYCSSYCSRHKIKKVDKKEGVFNTGKKKMIREQLYNVYVKSKGYILLLTSPMFPLPNRLKGQKFIAFENNNDMYYKLLANKPDNTDIYFGDVGNIKELSLKQRIEHAFLDFCGVYDTNKESIKKVIEKTNCDTLALTFALRGNKISIPKIIQNVQELGYSFINGDTYLSGCSMLFLFFKRIIIKTKHNKQKICSCCGGLFTKISANDGRYCVNCWKEKEPIEYLAFRKNRNEYRELNKNKVINKLISPQKQAWVTRRANNQKTI